MVLFMFWGKGLGSGVCYKGGAGVCYKKEKKNV
jgi:hypothetical protein